MLRISRLTDYATVILASLGGGALASAADIALRTHIGVPTVSKLLKQLQHAGLVRSVRGAHGGLQLGRPAAAITVADIVEAIEGRIALTACIDHTPCDFEAGCNMKPHWPIINNALRGALAGITLAQLRGPVAHMATSEDHLA